MFGKENLGPPGFIGNSVIEKKAKRLYDNFNCLIY